jgi:hypothetical protein
MTPAGSAQPGRERPGQEFGERRSMAHRSSFRAAVSSVFAGEMEMKTIPYRIELTDDHPRASGHLELVDVNGKAACDLLP